MSCLNFYEYIYEKNVAIIIFIITFIIDFLLYYFRLKRIKIDRNLVLIFNIILIIRFYLVILSLGKICLRDSSIGILINLLATILLLVISTCKYLIDFLKNR